MALLLIGIGIASIVVVAWSAKRMLDLAIFTFLLTLFVVPRAVYRFSEYFPHVGITEGSPAVFTYSLFLMAFAAYAVYSGQSPFERSWLPFLIGLCVFAIFVWEMNDLRLSGVLHFVTAALAAGFGYSITSRSTTRVFESALARSVALIAALEFLVCFAQLMNISVPGIGFFVVNDVTAETTAGRISGTTDHPGTLGKLAFLLVVIILPLFSSEVPITRRLAQISTVLLVFPLVFSEGRANFAAMLALFLCWPLVSLVTRTRSKSGGSTKKLVFAVFAIVVGAASFGIYASRFDDDPVGGPRERLLEVAMEQIPMRLWVGTGPNAYVDVVGRFDTLTARGWPVHSVPLLAIGELGLLCGPLLFIPVILLTVRSLKVRAIHDRLRDGAVVWLASLPGLVVIAGTGWGLLSGPVFMLMAFLLGVFSARVRRTSNDSPHVGSQAPPMCADSKSVVTT